MRSIRLSLSVYFVILLGVALGAVSLLVYHLTQQTLLAKTEKARELLVEKKKESGQLLKDLQATKGELLKAQCVERSLEESTRLDEALLSEARHLASVASVQFHYGRARFSSLYMLGLLTAGPSPNGHLLAPVWVAEGARSPLSSFIRASLAAQIELKEDARLSDDARLAHFLQINSEYGDTSWRSESMEGRTFPFSQNRFSDNLLDWEPDDVELEPGFTVRRVVLKAPVARVRYPWGPPPNQGRSERPPSKPRGDPGPPKPPPRYEFVGPPAPPRPELVGPPAPLPERFTERYSPSVFVHCAADTTGRDMAILQHEIDRDNQLARLRAEEDQQSARLEQELRDELARLEAESAATLASLRRRLLLISLAAFAAAVAGVFGLVRHGLAPLRRLSDAVSRVSERDFRLQFDEPRLPGELRPIVERLDGTLDLLKRAFAREKQAAADISHELRTPLTALLTTIEVALRKSRSPDEYRDLLAECRASGQQMSQLVERLLTLARLDAGVDRLRARPVDAAELAGQCAALVKPLAEARGLHLAVHCKGPADLTADPDKLREVLTNLLHNAIEYNRPEGSIDLTVARDNGHVRLEVRDTGIGIAPEARGQIFERFYRADPSRQADGLHAGLGLAIVKGYVELMGGTIAVESTPGEGSTFRVDLPADGDGVTR